MSPTDLCAEMLPIFGIWYGIQYMEGYAGEKMAGACGPRPSSSLIEERIVCRDQRHVRADHTGVVPARDRAVLDLLALAESRVLEADAEGRRRLIVEAYRGLAELALTENNPGGARLLILDGLEKCGDRAELLELLLLAFLLPERLHHRNSG